MQYENDTENRIIYDLHSLDSTKHIKHTASLTPAPKSKHNDMMGTDIKSHDLRPGTELHKQSASLLEGYTANNKTGSPNEIDEALPSVYNPPNMPEDDDKPYGKMPTTAKLGKRPVYPRGSKKLISGTGSNLSSSLSKPPKVGSAYNIAPERGNSGINAVTGRPRTGYMAMKKLIRIVNLRDIQSK